MFYHHDRKVLRELAPLWKPGVPVADNPDYVARARELDNDLETALAARQQMSDSERKDIRRRPGDNSASRG